MDKYLNVKLILDVGLANECRGRITKRSRGLHGEPLGRAHANPVFDTREYDIDFTDGSVDKYTAKIVAENMVAQVDDKSNQYLLMNDITDHRKNNTDIPKYDGITRGQNGNESPKITSIGL